MKHFQLTYAYNAMTSILQSLDLISFDRLSYDDKAELCDQLITIKKTSLN